MQAALCLSISSILYTSYLYIIKMRGSLSSLAQGNKRSSSSTSNQSSKRVKRSAFQPEPESEGEDQVVIPKAKKERLTADSLKWRTLNPATFSGFDDGGGMMMLEELDDVAVEWEMAEGGMKVARFVVS